MLKVIETTARIISTIIPDSTRNTGPPTSGPTTRMGSVASSNWPIAISGRPALRVEMPTP